MIPNSRSIVPVNEASRDLSSLREPSEDSTRAADAANHESGSEDGPDADAAQAVNTPRDYPAPRALNSRDAFDWFEDQYPVENYAGLGRRLARAGDLFRNSPYAGGLLLASPVPHVPPIPIRDGAALDAIIADRQRVRVLNRGNITAGGVPSRHLKTMLVSEAFLQQFRPVDTVERNSRFLTDFTLTMPGYNDRGYGERILHIGDNPWIELVHDATARFLDVMEFATEADRSNAVGAALTVLLRNLWPGAKPCLVVTSTKSHGGKETIVAFVAGTTRSASIGYESADWALQKAFVMALKNEPEIGLIDVENARLDRGQSEIRSAFLERYLTEAEPLLHTTGIGKPFRRANDVVVAITTNHGTVSEDLLNRALPIHLNPVGDVANRASPIGNPKLEYIPANRDRIVAELRGMVERWKREGCPLDNRVRHPSGPWSQTVGGILLVNGFRDFLGNYAHHKTADDPVRRGLGLLGAAKPGEWFRSGEWAALARSMGVVKAVIPPADRETDLGHERGIGVVLSAHKDETFSVETEDRLVVLKLKKARRRFQGGEEPQTRYCFAIVHDEAIPEDL